MTSIQLYQALKALGIDDVIARAAAAEHVLGIEDKIQKIAELANFK